MIDGIHHRRRIHVQLELLTGLLDNMLRNLLPTMVLLMFLVTVSCNVLITRMDGSKLEHPYLIRLTMSAWHGRLL